MLVVDNIIPTLLCKGSSIKIIFTGIIGASLTLLLGISREPAWAVGGTGGSSFIIQCDGRERLNAVLIRSGKRIDSIGIECAQGNNIRTFRAGGSGGTETRLAVSNNKWIVGTGIHIGKCNADSTRVCGIGFKWNDNTQSRFFGNQTNDRHNLPFPLTQASFRQELYGFRGRAGKNIDNLEPLYRNHVAPTSTGGRNVNAQRLADTFNTVLGRLEMHFNNLGTREGNSWRREMDSWIKISNLNIIRRFNVDDGEEVSIRRTRGIYRHFFYVNDINSQQVDVQFERNRSAFILRVQLESNSPEIKGKCRYKKPNGDYGRCPGANEGDGNTPDVQWERPAIEITLIPAVYNRNGVNGIVLRAQSARLRGDFRMNGLCSVVKNECRSILGDWEGKLRSSVEAEIADSLNMDAVQRAMANASRTVLNAANVRGQIVNAFISGNNVRVEWR